MRILFVAIDFPPARGGIQEWSLQIATHLAQRHEVHVLAAWQDGAQQFDRRLPVPITRFNDLSASAKGAPHLAGLLLTHYRGAKPDIILFSHLIAATTSYRLLGGLHVPFAVVLHGAELHTPALRDMIRSTIAACSACISVSHYTARLLAAQGINPTTITIIPPGIPESALDRPVDLRQREALSNHIPQDAPVLLTVARLSTRHKGHDMLLRALPLILAREPRAVYVIAGDGYHRHECELLAASLGIHDRVRFMGEVNDEQRMALYDRCDVFAMISREEASGDVEGFGLVFLEAAARGKPAVGGRSGGIPEAIVDGVTGLLVDPLNIEEIATASISLLTAPALARHLGEAGRARVREGFTWNHLAQRIEQRLADALEPDHTSKGEAVGKGE